MNGDRICVRIVRLCFLGFSVLVGHAFAQQPSPVNVSIATVANGPDYPFEATAGVPVAIEVNGELVFSGATGIEGSTAGLTLNAGEMMKITLGQVDAVLDNANEWDGHVVGKVIDLPVSSNYVSGKRNVFTQVLSQPFARNIHVVSIPDDDNNFPDDSFWWDLTVRENSGVSFRSNIAPLLNSEDIDGVFRYLSGAPPSGSYIFGIYMDNASVDIGYNNLILTMRFNDKDFVSTAVADVFHFLPAGVDVPEDPFFAQVLAANPGVDAALGVYLGGMLPEGKTLVMFRDLGTQPPFAATSTQLPPPVVLAQPRISGKGGAGPRPGSFCKNCTPKPSNDFINMNAGGCNPPAYSSDCPVGYLPKVDKFYWKSVGAIVRTMPGGPDLTVDYSASVGLRVTVDVSGSGIKAGGNSNRRSQSSCRSCWSAKRYGLWAKRGTTRH